MPRVFEQTLRTGSSLHSLAVLAMKRIAIAMFGAVHLYVLVARRTVRTGTVFLIGLALYSVGLHWLRQAQLFFGYSWTYPLMIVALAYGSASLAGLTAILIKGVKTSALRGYCSSKSIMDVRVVNQKLVSDHWDGDENLRKL